MTLVPIKLPLQSFCNLISIYISFLIYVNISLRFLLRQPDCPPCTGYEELTLQLPSRDRYTTFPVPTLSAMSIQNSYTGSYKIEQVSTKKIILSAILQAQTVSPAAWQAQLHSTIIEIPQNYQWIFSSSSRQSISIHS